MTYNVFGGTLSLTQSINQSTVWPSSRELLTARDLFQSPFHRLVTLTGEVLIQSGLQEVSIVVGS